MAKPGPASSVPGRSVPAPARRRRRPARSLSGQARSATRRRRVCPPLDHATLRLGPGRESRRCRVTPSCSGRPRNFCMAVSAAAPSPGQFKR
ncbi:hypothetical protein NL676_034496 [Syzygium grande]|nr:hypothetical protein NL676_034496 [Syzygium grande]